MKNLFFSMLFVLSLLFLISHVTDAAISCGTVDMGAASCVSFATGKDVHPSVACCSGLQKVASMAHTIDDKKAICRCLKAGVKNFAGVQDKILSKIPDACNIKVGFPVHQGIS